MLGFVAWALVAVSGTAMGQADDALRVKLRADPGPYFVGAGIVLRITVARAGAKPQVELPRVPGAEIWKIGTESQPITTTGIGSMVSHDKIFIIGLRLVPARAGTLEVPPIAVSAQGHTSHCLPLRLQVQPVPHVGRPPEFLGGVRRFSLSAEAVPRSVRVGQELEFRIKVTGPAAWGMSERPDLARFERSGLGLRITVRNDLVSHEPPERTFVYGIRPTRAGSAVLPPVVIAAFDPASSRFLSQATPGVPVEAIAVPSFDPATIDDGGLSGPSRRAPWIAWTAAGLSALMVVAASVALSVRRRRAHHSPVGPAAARRFAARLANCPVLRERRGMAATRARATDFTAAADGQSNTTVDDRAMARWVGEELIRYLAIAIGRPAGALTPDEAQEGVAQATGSENLGAEAANLAGRCDEVLYGSTDRALSKQDLRAGARGLFRALGRVQIPRT